MNKKVILMILDGWGITQNPAVSAPFQAKTPFIDAIEKEYPHATLRTDGEFVGLPDGQMGNSEVGHMNLGAGRIVYQNLVMINKALRENTLGKEKVLLDALAYAEKNGKSIHILGLVSDGGIHSHINHLKGLLKVAKENNAKNVFVHAFTDGRDCDPKSGVGFIKDLQDYMQETTGELASIVGRYYAMDRDNRWERVKKAYNVVVKGEGKHATNAVKALQESYDAGVTDEFVEPIVMVGTNDKPLATIQPDDVVIFFNYRTDRGRELTQALSQQDFPEQGMKKLPLYYVTMTNYDKNFVGIRVIYNNDNLTNTLGEVLSKAGKKQIRIAETEKYPHVTFFFSGGREEPFEGEKRLLCPSPKVATYDLKPEMSAYDIRDAIIPELKKQEVDFVCLNFANGDMVGHTGVLEAAVKACEAVDACTKAVIETGLDNGYTTLVIADHGNCEVMKNEDGSPNTAHTTNPVPFILVDKDKIAVKDGILGDIAPTILKLMGVEQPEEMTQYPLV
ncbi:2,3-bisphosphoglycerate-independent phosphoglycerate mutase [Capnocytophaga catalasegens]|uniref:2,3-bisphosphoglycerate-independent phosphoglycerate mutase n=1 Tax=Capnocytophaga catalasegens TaxID=1004260 RepID=A0AAV5B0J3_9FLAO|nr:2,3-bisphosphoglycerate-independent phosphoglycerate mutase [Capnocytophaga catalasegens]GIZ14800.1 2,3-bisphosphoglycerate-independent phosphoglycerate mutase [Capnocytophaga catalasegens]GJM51168.1 2,3-bisphosphoglycerate-independent phosphoglycerate mutase [Capnocytophaga catalasegens]GJM53521.1 2,3-bisphosphoglycerate-independent phosphoglycerate mutase [Capnocytophaga catalasegens]